MAPIKYPKTKQGECRHCGTKTVYRRRGSGKVWPPRNTQGQRDYYYVGDYCHCPEATKEREGLQKVSREMNQFFNRLGG